MALNEALFSNLIGQFRDKHVDPFAESEKQNESKVQEIQKESVKAKKRISQAKKKRKILKKMLP